jgi:hypothetical protein
MNILLSSNSHHDSSADIAIGYRLDGLSSVPSRGNTFLSTPVSTGSGSHLASYTMGTRRFHPGCVKQLGCEVDHSPPPTAEVKNGGSVPPFPHMSLWHGVKFINYRDGKYKSIQM